MKLFKKYIPLIFTLFLAKVDTCGQQIAVENLQKNELTIGIENEIIIFVENTPCSQIVIKTSNGLIKKAKDRCHYSIVPLSHSTTELEVYKRMKGKLVFIGYKYFKSKLFEPTPIVGIANKLSETTTIQELTEVNELDLSVTDLCMGAETFFKIEKFQVDLLTSNNELIASYNNFGKVFSDELKNALRNLTPKDKIKFHHIYILTNYNYQMHLSDSNYLIVE